MPRGHYKALTDSMVHQKISNDMRERALFLPLEAEWEIERIAEALGVLARSIGRLEEKYALHGCVKPLKSIKRRPRLLTGDMIILVSARQSALL